MFTGSNASRLNFQINDLTPSLTKLCGAPWQACGARGAR